MHEKNQLIKDCIDLRACSYSSWYNDFQKITIKSHCEPIPQALVDYFLDEIIILPKECYATETDLPEDDDEDGALEMEVSASKCSMSCIPDVYITRNSSLDSRSQSFPSSVE